MKFTTKLIALFAAIFLVSSSVVVYFIYYSNIRTLEDEIKDRLEDQAFHTMDKIDRMLYERYTDIKFLAADPVISSKNSTPKQISEKLRQYLKSYKIYASLSFFNMNRIRLADTTGKRIGEQHAGDDYWVDILKGRDLVLDIHQSTSLKQPAFHFASIVRDSEGAPIGVVVSRMPASVLYDILKLASGIHSKEEHLNIDLIDRDGLILYSTYNTAGILKERAFDAEFVKSSLARGLKIGSRRHYHPVIGDAIHVFVSEPGYQEFRGNGWALIVYFPEQEAIAPAVALRNRLLFIFSVTGALILLSMLFFLRKVTKPLIDLHDAAAAIGTGNLDATVKVASNDEVGALAGSFNKMAMDLKESHKKLLAHSQELETRVEERTSTLAKVNEQLQIELIERERIEEKLLQLKETAVAASRAKTEFIANMNHELRTPLNSVIGFSEVLNDELYGSLNAKQKEYLADIMTSGRHLLSLINNILDISKVEAGRMELETGLFLLSGAIDTSMAMLREKANKHNISLSLDMKPGADIYIEADERKFKQIMLNLLSNALKFMPDGGSVRVSAQKGVRGQGLGVREKPTPDTDFLEISVTDSGIGIKPEDIPNLFKEFTQLESAYTKKHEGTGLGLSLTRKMVELHGGKIWAESEFGKGSAFVFTIPVRNGEHLDGGGVLPE
ncbi:MAG: HAMP domain-containing protein [Nitrospirae bacterium]|nr:HAMP domain-containing protein [Nitrospirota bacterium]